MLVYCERSKFLFNLNEEKNLEICAIKRLRRQGDVPKHAHRIQGIIAAETLRHSRFIKHWSKNDHLEVNAYAAAVILDYIMDEVGPIKSRRDGQRLLDRWNSAFRDHPIQMLKTILAIFSGRPTVGSVTYAVNLALDDPDMAELFGITAAA